MNKQFKQFLLIFFVLATLIFSNSSQAQSAQPTITDSANDVSLVQTSQGTSGKPNIKTQTVSSQPNIDILSASYVANTNGSASISLKVKGQIENDNQTYYNIKLVGVYLSPTKAYTIIIDIYYTQLLSVKSESILRNVQYSFTNDSTNGFGPMHSYVDGSTLTTTIEPNLTTATNDKFSVILPKSFPENEVEYNLAHHRLPW